MDSNPRSPRKRDIDFRDSTVRHNLPASARGTEGSNPPPSSGESDANLTSSIRDIGFTLRADALERFKYVDGPEYKF
jgi:hypothetical protein